MTGPIRSPEKRKAVNATFSAYFSIAMMIGNDHTTARAFALRKLGRDIPTLKTPWGGPVEAADATWKEPDQEDSPGTTSSEAVEATGPPKARAEEAAMPDPVDAIAASHFAPHLLGKLISLFAQAVNEALERRGLQTKLPIGEWSPTEHGMQYCSCIVGAPMAPPTVRAGSSTSWARPS